MEMLIALGFVLFTFILETIILAANDWKVSRKTPMYKFVYSEFPEFCKAFWMSLVMYCTMWIIATVVFAMIIGTGTVVFAGMMYLTKVTVAGFAAAVILTFLLAGIATLYFIIEIIPKNLRKLSSNTPKQQNALAKGLSNWYSQFKDKYCPILEEED